jgi:hypothetical protein
LHILVLPKGLEAFLARMQTAMTTPPKFRPKEKKFWANQTIIRQIQNLCSGGKIVSFGT